MAANCTVTSTTTPRIYNAVRSHRPHPADPHNKAKPHNSQKFLFFFAIFLKKLLTNVRKPCIISTVIWVWRRLVARYLGVVEAAGSNPVTQTKGTVVPKELQCFFMLSKGLYNAFYHMQYQQPRKSDGRKLPRPSPQFSLLPQASLKHHISPPQKIRHRLSLQCPIKTINFS